MVLDQGGFLEREVRSCPTVVHRHLADPYPGMLALFVFFLVARLKALAERKRVRKKEREAAARLRSRVAMGMENTAVDLPIEEGIFSLASIKVTVLLFLSACVRIGNPEVCFVCKPLSSLLFKLQVALLRHRRQSFFALFTEKVTLKLCSSFHLILVLNCIFVCLFFLFVYVHRVVSWQTGGDLEAIRDVDLSKLEASSMDVAGDDASGSDGTGEDEDDSDDDR